MKELCKEKKIENIELSYREKDKNSYLRGNGIKIGDLPVINRKRKV